MVEVPDLIRTSVSISWWIQCIECCHQCSVRDWLVHPLSFD